MKLIEYLFSEDSVSSNPCVGPLPRTKITFSYYQFLMNSYLHQKEQLPINFAFISLPYASDGFKTLSAVIGTLNTSSEIPLDFHSKI